MFVRCFAGAVAGVRAIRITVEVNVAAGGMGIYIVGLPDNAVKESEHRIRAAFGNSQRHIPGKKMVVNLAPADIRKEGSAFDLPIAVGILAATEQISTAMLADTIFAGELSLDGAVKPVRGVLPIAIMAREQGMRRIIVSPANAAEAAVVEGLEVIAVHSLAETADFLDGEIAVEPYKSELYTSVVERLNRYAADFADVRGQQTAKRALEIAAAGGHNVLMVGAPGSGKTMLARRLPSIMPPMTLDEAIECTEIHSVAGTLAPDAGLLAVRPFRAPHHLASQVSLVGGGQTPKPGEASLAHNGVLFLDELPEFGRNVLEVLRQPLEDRTITVSRARYSVEYPCSFTLVAAMNPCPCGYYNHPTRQCTCSPAERKRYLGRISGPLLDRMDMHVEVMPVRVGDMQSAAAEESSEQVRRRVTRARSIQSERFAGTGIYCNAMMTSAMLRKFCPLGTEVQALLQRAMTRLDLSARAYDRIIKVARTIADLDGKADIGPEHISESITFRVLDRGSWAV